MIDCEIFFESFVLIRIKNVAKIYFSRKIYKTDPAGGRDRVRWDVTFLVSRRSTRVNNPAVTYSVPGTVFSLLRRVRYRSTFRFRNFRRAVSKHEMSRVCSRVPYPSDGGRNAGIRSRCQHGRRTRPVPSSGGGGNARRDLSRDEKTSPPCTEIYKIL